MNKKYFKKNLVQKKILSSFFFVFILIFGQIFSPQVASAATYNFTQNSWDGAVNSNLATHPDNQSNWIDYSSNTGLVLDQNITLPKTTLELSQTSYTDFNTGTNTQTQISGLEDLASIKLSKTNFAEPLVVQNKHNEGSTYALKSDGTVWSWGNNGDGQLGDNSTSPSKTPVQVLNSTGTGPLTGIISLVAGESVYALKSDGTVWSWGFNGEGRLGDGTTTARKLPVQVVGPGGVGYLTDVVSIYAGPYSAYAIKSDGTVWAWGKNTNGQLSDGTTTNRYTPVQVMSSDGVTPMADIVEIASGVDGSNSFTYFLKNNGTVFGVGFNANGELGIDNTTSKTLPVQVLNQTGTGPLDNIVSVRGGEAYGLFLKSDGTVFASGYNNLGRLGDGTQSQRNLPVQVVGSGGVGYLSDIIAISNTHSSSYALKSDGTVWAWGSNVDGRLGDGTGDPRLSPIQVRGVNNIGYLTNVIKISGGSNSVSVLKSDGSVYSWGKNTLGQLGNDTLLSSNLPVQTVWVELGNLNIGNPTPSEVSGGLGSSYLLKPDGTVWSWGVNGGRLGDGTNILRKIPVQVHGTNDVGYLTNVEKLAGGNNSAYVVKDDGTVWSWGLNSSGQLGDGTKIEKYTPIQVLGPGGVGYLSNITKISGGYGGTYDDNDFAVALRSDGTVWSWGTNSVGQLGNGNTTDSYVPTQVVGPGGVGYLTDVVDISSGLYMTLALKSDGTVWAWGKNNSGQLGDGTTSNSSSPVQVKGVGGSGYLSGISKVEVSLDSGGTTSAYAVSTSGNVYSWGNYYNGRLGRTGSAAYPGLVLGLGGAGYLSNVNDVKAGGGFVLALKNDGTLWAWGKNDVGQLGNGNYSTADTPVQVLDLGGASYMTNAVNMYAGKEHSLVIKSNGDVYSWGSNTYGKLGDGTEISKNIPVNVKGYLPAVPLNIGTSSYYSSGNYLSQIFDLTKKSELVDVVFSTNPNGQPISIDVRAGNTATPDASWTNWLTGISSGGSLSSISNNQYIQYRVNLSTNNTKYSPELNSITINYNQFTETGELISSKYDTTDISNVISRMSWLSSNISNTELIKLQVRSSSDGNLWSEWCGFDNCSGSNYFETEDNGIALPLNHPLKTDSDDQFLQYKVILSSGGGITPVLNSVSVQYVVNARPLFNNDYPSFGSGGVVAYQNKNISSADFGKINISYSAKDVDTSTGSITPNQITPSFEYSIDGGSTWEIIPNNHLALGDGDLKNILEDSYTEYNATWSVKTTIPEVSVDNAKIRVSINDNEAANNIASAVSANFSLDTKAPVITSPVTLDAGVAGLSQGATINIPLPLDLGGIEYRIRDNATTESNPVDTGWLPITENISIPWTFDADVEVKSIYINLRDDLHNESETSTIFTLSPIPVASFMVQDTSNIINASYYDVYLGWEPATLNEKFYRYKLDQASSPDNINYSSFSEIGDSSLLDISTNYHVVRNLNTDLFYKYQISVVDTDGNTSVRIGYNIVTKPDGVQNYGEGGGGVASKPAKIENVIVSQGLDKNVTVNFKLTDATTDKKVNPSYESYLFFNNGIVVSSNALSGTTLKISDASKLKNSGYVLINNEVIKYTGKSGNTLTGITRGTWPNLITSGRTTRANSEFFEGTPVWVIAEGTSPIIIDSISNDLKDGENFVLEWNTYNEINLLGSVYENLGIRVLVHDNQDALSGPLTNQNDFSEDGVISVLDLTAPLISFATTDIATGESVVNFEVEINLDRPYAFDSSVNYSISGTATAGADYSLSEGLITIPKDTTKYILSIPIQDDLLKEENETIVISLSEATNSILGINSIFTLTINDNDSNPGVGFSQTSVTNTENTTSVTIPIPLVEISGVDVVVSYSVSGTATSNSDYVLENGSVTILAGELSTNINLTIIDDTLKENSENILITLTGATGALVGENNIMTYTINDNDNYPTLVFDALTSQAKEDANIVNIVVKVSSPYPENITFNYVVIGGSAEGSGVDYRIENNSASIPAGESSVNIPIVIYDDDSSEETENIILNIVDPINAVLGAETTHAFSILDNEILISDINGSSVKSTSARIAWTTADYTDSLIEYGTIPHDQEGAYAMSKQSLEKVLNHNVYLDELTPSTTYYFKTTSVNLVGETTVSRSQFTTTPGPVISGVSSSNQTDTSVTLSWVTDIPSTSSVFYATDPTMISPLSKNDSGLVQNHSISLTELLPNEIYYYIVSSSDESGNVGESANGGSYYTFTTNDDETAPIVSNIKTPIRTNSQVAITWNTNELTDGLVRYGEESGNLDQSTELIQTPMTAHLAAISDLEESTQYYYVIESTDENGNKTTTSEGSFETTEKEKEVVYSGGGSSGVAQELYDILLAENQAYKAKYSTLNTEEPTISNIEISNVTAFGATITFNTSEDTVAFIKYNKEGQNNLITGSDTWSQRHSIKLTGLSLGTEYDFVISAMDKSNDTGTSDKQKFTTKYLSENLSELNSIENVEQFQKEIENTIESILPSLVPPFIEKPSVSDITENSAVITYRTNIKSFPVVSFTEDSKYKKESNNLYDGEISNTTEKSTAHTIKLQGLRPNTLYHFSAKAYSLPGVIGKYEDMVFTTAASKIQASVVDMKKDSFSVVWYTDEPTSSIVEYKNLKTGRSAKIVEGEKNTSHSIKIENLEPGTSYEVLVSGINSKGNIVESNSVINVKTSTDNIPPVVTNLKVDSALVQGRTDRVQTIVSWQTDEPSDSVIQYQEGTGGKGSDLSNKDQNLELTKNHVMILGSLKPGTVYRFSVSSTDDVGNVTKLPVRTIITPKKTESIVDVIFKNFDDTFNFINNVR